MILKILQFLKIILNLSRFSIWKNIAIGTIFIYSFFVSTKYKKLKINYITIKNQYEQSLEKIETLDNLCKISIERALNISKTINKTQNKKKDIGKLTVKEFKKLTETVINETK